MTTYYIRTATEAEMQSALIAAGVLVPDGDELVVAAGLALDMVGQIYRSTGQTEQIEVGGEVVEQPVYAAVPGWHANLLGELSAEQLTQLPVIDPPATPARRFWL
ncbi:hypothetical protein V8Z80_08605 [Orrella sp. JC864]|uniref:hypothetical protein n=1 Tax=Orrella sp. JC864 TaxID=3120298 RepID=UPI0030088D43